MAACLSCGAEGLGGLTPTSTSCLKWLLNYLGHTPQRHNTPGVAESETGAVTVAPRPRLTLEGSFCAPKGDRTWL